MFGRKSRAEQSRHDTRSAAMRGLERGRHRVEAIRESLPEADEVLATLREQAESVREQAEPVIKAAREQVEKSPVAPKKKKRSKKPFLLLGLAIIGVVAYLFFTRRDKEPAYLMDEPQRPDLTPAQPGPNSGNGYSPGGPSGTPANGEDVPERASAYMAQQPAQPTQAESSSTPPAPGTQPMNFQASSAPSYRYEPSAQIAAWDLPSSGIPPMRGGAQL